MKDQKRNLLRKRNKVQRKGTTSELVAAQADIFMGEDMNAKIPFEDCIEVQFGEQGNIE